MAAAPAVVCRKSRRVIAFMMAKLLNVNPAQVTWVRYRL
jgi:hypothetical protein